MCLCRHGTYHAVWSGYNHRSKGLKTEQMDLQELEYLFFPPKPALVHCIVASKVSLKKVQDVLCVRLWSFANLHLQLFPSQAAVQIAVTAVLHETGDTIGFYWCKSSMCCGRRKSVFHLGL